jgi:tetratricopeptide (TPR) repeat protein
VLIQIGKLDEALDQFSKVAGADGTKVDAVVKIGLIHFEQERYEDAAFWFKEALKLNPALSKVRYYLATTYEESEDFDKAIEEFQRIVASEDTYVDSRVHLAFIFEKDDKYEEAINALKDALKVKGSDPSLYRLLASLYKDVDKYDEAIGLIEDALMIFPDDSELHFTLGVLCDQNDGGLDCLDHMRKVVELNPENASALNYIGYTYVENNIRLEEAEKLLLQALAIEPESGHIIDSIGWLYYVKGDYDKAIEALERATKYMPEDPVVAEHLGDAYLKKSLNDKAIALYEKARELDPKNKTLGGKLNNLKGKLRE